MIQRFLCPACGATQEVPVDEVEVGSIEVDCLCGASMVPSGPLQPEPLQPEACSAPMHPAAGRWWVVILSALLLPLIVFLALLFH